MKRLVLILAVLALLLSFAGGASSEIRAQLPEVAAATVRTMPEPEPEPEITYVLNKNTKKFHYPDCASIDEMKAKNRLDVNWDRDEVIAKGYVPCKRCNP